MTATATAIVTGQRGVFHSKPRRGLCDSYPLLATCCWVQEEARRRDSNDCSRPAQATVTSVEFWFLVWSFMEHPNTRNHDVTLRKMGLHLEHKKISVACITNIVKFLFLASMYGSQVLPLRNSM